MQFSLAKLFQLVGVICLACLVVDALRLGRPDKAVMPLLVLGAVYCSLVGYRLRKTIARFPWEVTKFAVSWVFLIGYGLLLFEYWRSRTPVGWLASPIVNGFFSVLAPFAIWALYCISDIYRRSKVDPEEDLC